MIWKRVSREALRRHEDEAQREAAEEHHRQRAAGFAQPECLDRLRGIEAEPGGRRGSEHHEPEQAADGEAGIARRPPQQPMPARKPQHAEHAAAQSVQDARGDARGAGDRIVRGAKLLIAPVERFRHVHEIAERGELVAGDDEPHPEARLGDPFVAALVDERVIDAAGGAGVVCLVEQVVGREFHAPVGARACFGDLLRRLDGQRETGGIGGHERLGEMLGEAVRRAVGTEADRRLAHLARAEQTHLPPVRRIDAAGDELREGVLAAALELDVILRRLVLRKLRRGSCIGGGQRPLGRDRLGALEGAGAIHRDLEIDDRNRQREEPPRDQGRRARDERVDDPERGLAD